MPLASKEDLRKLRVGVHLGSLGYPGELLEQYAQGFDAKANRYKTVVATFKDGWVGRLTNYKFEAADFEHSTIIQHSASLSGGTSGSPMFTADGKVVGASFGNRQIYYDVTKRLKGEAQSRLHREFALDPSEIGYAIRIDVLRQFYQEQGWK